MADEMNKTDLIEHIAKHADLSKAGALRAYKAMTEAITATMRKGKTVGIVGFGTFYTTKRKARKGRDPRNGKPIDIAATRLPKFRPGKDLKEFINK